MTAKGWVIFATLCIAILGGMVWVAQKSRIDVTDIDENRIQVASELNGNIGDHVYGNRESKVVLIEYGDFQCPGCKPASPVVKSVVEKYKDKIAFVFRNYPLYTIHPNAFAASAVAEAAGLQNKYWEMHAYLFENQTSWDQLSGTARADYFVSAATMLGLDTDKFTADIDSAPVKAKIDFDTQLGKKKGLTGTPTFYIDGKDVGSQYVLDGQLVSSTTEGAQTVWTDELAFETYVIIPALKQAGIPFED
ncbi:hypothetical protein EOL96_00980 [Candidatus Saccharibacteria bacterium]|nr:hypothetical protein [Candidatus Saccharibacteria bacterium]